MIIRQTTTIVFEYPQDYLQEQEWCKTKEDRWIHKGTDTLCSIYENTISYSIGQPIDRKTEPIDKDINVRSKTEPQTEVNALYDQIVEDIDTRVKCANAKKVEDEPQTMYYPQVDGITPTVITEDRYTQILDAWQVKLKAEQTEPQIDCRRCKHYATGKCKECFGHELFTDSGYATDCSWQKGASSEYR